MQENIYSNARSFQHCAIVFLRQRFVRQKRRPREFSSSFASRVRLCALGYLLFFAALSLFGNSLHAFLPHCHELKSTNHACCASVSSLTQDRCSSRTVNCEPDDNDCPICSFFSQYRTVVFVVAAIVVFLETPKKLRLTLPHSRSRIPLFVSFGRAPPVAAL